MTPPLSVELTSTRGNGLRVSISGEIDCQSTDLLSERLADALDQRAARMIIDVGLVDFISRVGLQLLREIAMRADAEGVPVTFVNCSDFQRVLFHLNSIDRVARVIGCTSRSVLGRQS